MKIIIMLAMTALVAGPAQAATESYKDAPARARAAYERRAHILSSRPVRREAPIREMNISDDEVLEVQHVAYTVLPHDIVNIANVVTGCPCEEGPQCTDQLWIIANRSDGSSGLSLSKINKHWVIGPVQQWWLYFDELQSKRRTFTSYAGFAAAENQLIDRFPACGVRFVTTDDSPAAPSDMPRRK